MLKILYHKDFQKDFKKLSRNFRLLFNKKFLIFVENPDCVFLKDHALKGRLEGRRAFSATGDIRVVYRYVEEDIVMLLRIGSHNQVY
ncbi:hypothetical protein A2335_02245 [Candidatus Peregrinibacteria bacterium RIFOXYB2_FULL_32_7]|nr:MAG: hypothetical protein A2335_02245 [Candidatus Peregrinibacteria bacterium RIFOXYB2_FULL_32_7]